jgi:sialate O-acetylesterase
MKTTILLSSFVMLTVAEAKVELPPIISSHMVLQRDMAVPIWGTADNGETVTVKFRGQQKQTTADGTGKWMIKLDPLKAGGPDTLTVNDIVLEDVLVGEVWVGSGQSNMQMPAADYVKGDPVLASNVVAAPYPKIRLASASKPWVEATDKNVSDFSALLFSFGLPLQKEIDVPVGLIVGAVGGTCSGYWISQEAIDADPGCQAAIARANADEAARQDYQQKLAEWEAKVATGKKLGRGNPKPLKPGECGRETGFLYKQHIRPLQPYAIRGVLWDQGESGVNIGGIDQYTLMGALIRGWRKEWGQGDFPWIYVQKPSGGGCSWDGEVKPNASKLPGKAAGGLGDAEDFLRMMQYPNTAMAISSDLGSGIHPTDKSAYGQRAATVAIATVYGKAAEPYGPIYASHATEEGKLRVKFTHIGKGLAFKHGDKLQGFAIAGEDKVFHWADAVIDGDTVILGSSAVPNPVAIRYGWAKIRGWANLFNKDGLPAVPFRTDSW